MSVLSILLKVFPPNLAKRKTRCDYFMDLCLAAKYSSQLFTYYDDFLLDLIIVTIPENMTLQKYIHPFRNSKLKKNLRASWNFLKKINHVVIVWWWWRYFVYSLEQYSRYMWELCSFLENKLCNLLNCLYLFFSPLLFHVVLLCFSPPTSSLLCTQTHSHSYSHSVDSPVRASIFPFDSPLLDRLFLCSLSYHITARNFTCSCFFSLVFIAHLNNIVV